VSFGVRRGRTAIRWKACKISKAGKEPLQFGIDFTGGLKDRAAPDVVLIVLDRTAREQVDFTAENVLDFLMKLKRAPPKMDFGPECNQQVDIAAEMRFAASEGAEYFEPGHAVTLAKGGKARL
jgi:hypothetical protein